MVKTSGEQFIYVLADGIFETGAEGVPSKSQNPAILGQGGPSSTQCSNLAPSVWHHRLPSISTCH